MNRLGSEEKSHRRRSKRNPENPVNLVKTSTLVAALLRWFNKNARDLPWRHTLDPYAIWVSEIMLQQTQVKTVLPYFEPWMRELPTIKSLADASSEKIHKLWEGLGYYTRVRNMQKAAREIARTHEGKFPRDFDAVLALPGIGRYTAGAICSIAFNQPKPILDGNVIRVLTRVFGIRENAREKETNRQLWNLAESLVVTAADLKSEIPNSKSLAGSCSALNQSLMELGATVCTPRQPRCEICALARNCFARRNNCADALPNIDERPATTARRFIACVIERGGEVLVRQRPAGVVNAHLWEFPNVEVPLRCSLPKARTQLEAELGCELHKLTSLLTVKHTITRYRITLDVFVSGLNGDCPDSHAGQWLPIAKARELSFTSAHGRILRHISTSP
jgi:A/G-specific adenine glycosylase